MARRKERKKKGVDDTCASTYTYIHICLVLQPRMLAHVLFTSSSLILPLFSVALVTLNWHAISIPVSQIEARPSEFRKDAISFLPVLLSLSL